MKKMNKMGKWLLIFGIVALVSAIAFGVSVVALGLSADNIGEMLESGTGIDFLDDFMGGFSVGKKGIYINDNGTVISYEFEKNKAYSGELDGSGLSDMKIDLASCKATVSCADTDKVSFTYTASGRAVEFDAEVNDGKLTIKEKPTGFNFFIFDLGSHSSELTLTVPEKLYSSITANLASGRISGSGLTAGSFKADVASGSVELGIYSDKIEINLASGKVDLTNSTENTAEKIKIDVASGNVSLKGYKANDTVVEIASGHVTLDGISGKVKGKLASGKLVLTYAEWNGDLDIELLSGGVDATLPAGSGIDLDFERASGSCKVDLDGNGVSLNKSSNVTLGGSNVHNVKIDVASGSANIHN